MNFEYSSPVPRPTRVVQPPKSSSRSNGSRLAAWQRVAGNAATAQLLAVQRQVPPVAPAEPVVIGVVYTIRGTVDGKAALYTGSTIRELTERIYKDPHTWRMLARSKSTSIEICTITATPRAEATARGTLRAAYNQAIRAAEQVVLKRNRMAAGEIVELNEMNAATEENIELWGDLHNVRIGPRMPFKAGVKIGGVVVFELLQVFMMYRDHKLEGYVWAPYLLEDDQGVFTLRETDRGIFRPNWYWKEYKTGANVGTRVQISKDEFRRLQSVAETLWGTVDWAGDFVPGLLQQELPVVPDESEA